MRKIYGKGLNFAAQLNSTRKKIIDYQQIQELRDVPIRKLNCGYLQSYFLLQNGQVLKIGNVMDALVNVRQINLYRFLPSILHTFQKLVFLGKTLSFKGGHEKLTTLNMDLLSQGIIPQNAEFGLSRIFLTDFKGDMYSLGQNYFGQLGINDTITLDQTFRKVYVPNKESFKTVKTGFQHTCFITQNGNLYGCGKADSYQIQPMNFKSRRSDINVIDKVVQPSLIWKGNVKMVGCGFKHTVFSTDGNQVYSLGNNKYGQCGHSYKEDIEIMKPKKIYFPLKKSQMILDIQCGFNHSLILTNQNLYFFGCTEQNQNPFEKYSENLSSPTILKVPFKPIKIYTNFDRISVIGEKGQCLIFGGNDISNLGGQNGSVEDLSQKFGSFSQKSLIGIGFGHTLVSR